MATITYNAFLKEKFSQNKYKAKYQNIKEYEEKHFGDKLITDWLEKNRGEKSNMKFVNSIATTFNG
jgi:hypothetical protein